MNRRSLFSTLPAVSWGSGVHSQIDLHKEYGGVVPDLASREHLRNFFLYWSIRAWWIASAEIRQIVVTNGPGLAGCLALGIAFARSLGLACRCPWWEQITCAATRFRPLSIFTPLRRRTLMWRCEICCRTSG